MFAHLSGHDAAQGGGYNPEGTTQRDAHLHFGRNGWVKCKNGTQKDRKHLKRVIKKIKIL